MKTYQIATAAIVLAALSGCNNGGGNNDGSADTGDGNNPPVNYPDGGSGFTGDAGFDPGVISVSCTPAVKVTPVNTPVTITCAIDSGGRSIGTPTLSSSPADGVVLGNGMQLGVATFSLTTNKPGYHHPIDFADSVYTVTMTVTASTGEYGRGQAHITVLGNYWVGDNATNGQGIYVYASNGDNIGQAVGPAGITGVTGLTMLPSGDIVASSAANKTISVFTRKGVPEQIQFATTDSYNNFLNIWTDLSFSSAGPHHMAVSSLGELWVTGAAEKPANAQAAVPGIAVFNPRDGSLSRFIPTPDTDVNDQDYVFTSIARRTDGIMAVSSSERSTICLFNEQTYASSGCTPVDNVFFDASFPVLLAMADGQIIAGTRCQDTTAGLVLLSPTLAAVAKQDQVESPDMRGLSLSGNDIVALGEYGDSVGNTLLMRFTADTLQPETPDWVVYAGQEVLYESSGLVRLTPLNP